MITFKEKPNTKEELLGILHPIVQKWFFSKFNDFSMPQLFGVMEIHSRKNTLVTAPTGATKTLTGFLSVLNELIDSSEKGILENRIYCVYISPLKALNEDIKVNLITPLQEMEKIAGKEFGIRVGVRTGDTTTAERAKMTKIPPHIFITTPESLAILLSTIKFKEHLRKVDWCIIDEVHALAENKRGVHLSLSLERLQQLSGYMTRVGLSATVAPIEEVAKFLVGFDENKESKQKERDCTIIDTQFIKKLDLKVLSPVPDLINTTHEQMHNAMYELIDKLVQEHKTTLIFTNTRAATERVVNHLKERFPKNYSENIGAHHGSLSKEHRHKIESSLREGKIKIVEHNSSIPSPFAFGLLLEGHMDILAIEDKVEFLRRMHEMVLAKIAKKHSDIEIPKRLLENSSKNKHDADFSYEEFWKEMIKQQDEKIDKEQEKLKMQLWDTPHIPGFPKLEILKMIRKEKDIDDKVISAIEKYKEEIKTNWPEELKEFVFSKVKELKL